MEKLSRGISKGSRAFIAIITKHPQEAKVVEDACDGYAMHYLGNGGLPAWIPKIYIGTDSNYGNSIKDIERRRHKDRNSIFLYRDCEIPDFMSRSLPLLSDVSWALPKPCYDDGLNHGGIAYSSNKNGLMSIYYSFIGGVLRYRLLYGETPMKGTVPFSFSNMYAKNLWLYTPFFYTANAYLHENRQIMSKYKKFSDKAADAQEEKSIKHNGGIVEKGKTIMVVNESGQKKQLLREQI